MKVCMVGSMMLGVDFTTGMMYQRKSREQWRQRITLVHHYA
jgi:hypothetical protein